MTPCYEKELNKKKLYIKKKVIKQVRHESTTHKFLLNMRLLLTNT